MYCAHSFVQWLAAVAIAVGYVVLHAQAMEELGDAPAAEGFGDMLGGIGPMVVSLSMTLPGLLVAILLMLLAIYRDRAVGT